MYVYYDNSLREGPVEVGLFVHGKCFMYRIGCSTPQLVYIKKIFNSVFAELQHQLRSCKKNLVSEQLHRELSHAITMLMVLMCVWHFLWFVQEFLGYKMGKEI